MALSEYEQRVLAEIESDLETALHKRFVRLRAVLLAFWPVILWCMVTVAMVVILLVFAPKPIATPFAALLGTSVGFVIGKRRHRPRPPRSRPATDR